MRGRPRAQVPPLPFRLSKRLHTPLLSVVPVYIQGTTERRPVGARRAQSPGMALPAGSSYDLRVSPLRHAPAPPPCHNGVGRTLGGGRGCSVLPARGRGGGAAATVRVALPLATRRNGRSLSPATNGRRQRSGQAPAETHSVRSGQQVTSQPRSPTTHSLPSHPSMGPVTSIYPLIFVHPR